MNLIKSTSKVLYKFMILIGIILMIPMVMILFYNEDLKYIFSFLIPAILSIIFGIICYYYSFKFDKNNESFNIKNGSIVVLFMWVYSFFLGSLPFVIGKQLTFVQALFESISGWTTTGLSTMDVRYVPKIFLFYRSFMQYCGGVGFVLIMVMFFHEKQAMILFDAEGHPDKLAPNLKKTVKKIILIYIFYLIIGIFFYCIFGMNLFEAINHSMCSLSTGGFSTRYDSIGAYNNIYIEAITILLMVIGTTNFAVLLLIFQKKFKQFLCVSEIKLFATIIIIAVPILVASLTSGIYIGLLKGFRISIFNIVSALSTSGYSTVSYSNWPAFSIGLLIILMLIGGGIGSTAGGIKLTRVYVVYKVLKENIKIKLSTSRMVSVPYYYRAQGKTYIDKFVESEIFCFVLMYIVIFFTGSLLITLSENCSIDFAMFEFASSLGTVGLSIGITGPTTNNFTLVIEMIGMFLGRLEIFIIIVGINSVINSIKEKFLLK